MGESSKVEVCQMPNVLDWVRERNASAAPGKRDELFQDAAGLSREDFDKLFDARCRSHQGFSVVPPTPPFKPKSS